MKVIVLRPPKWASSLLGKLFRLNGKKKKEE